MLKNSRLEKLAQKYVETCGDAVASYKLAFEDASEGKTVGRIKKLFDALVSKDALFWRRVAELQKPVEQQIALSSLAVLQEWSKIAMVDATALSGVRTSYERCGNGCDALKPPGTQLSAKCEECEKPRLLSQYVYIEDTDKLTPEQKKLFKAAEQTKYGIKLHLRDQDLALMNIAKANGMFTERYQLINNKPAELPLPPLPDDPNEASRLYTEWVSGT